MLGKSAAYINVHTDTVKEFIYYVLASERVKRYYELELTGTTIRNLSLGSIKNTPIAFPNHSEQRKIAAVLSSVDSMIFNRSNWREQVLSLKKALMQDLLTGKVRVKVN